MINEGILAKGEVLDIVGVFENCKQTHRPNLGGKNEKKRSIPARVTCLDLVNGACGMTLSVTHYLP